jgi:hypothetical protein
MHNEVKIYCGKNQIPDDERKIRQGRKDFPILALNESVEVD